MKIDILTIFPDFFRGPLDYGIIRRAREAGLAVIEVHDLRTFARDRHRTVDDRPFGGGEGMVLKPEPIFECIEGLHILSREQRLNDGASQSVVLLSAQGRRFEQKLAKELAASGELLCRSPLRVASMVTAQFSSEASSRLRVCSSFCGDFPCFATQVL